VLVSAAFHAAAPARLSASFYDRR